MDRIVHALPLALLAITVLLVYGWHIRRHPWMKCDRCHGSGTARHLGMSPFGTCGSCRGKGKRLRLAAWALGYDLDSGAKKR